jgi:hypothetical protein
MTRFSGIERQERLDRHSARIKHARESYERAVARAIDAGFSEREAPFAAQAFLMASTVKRPTVGQIRRHLRAEYPFLFEEAS